MIAIDQFGVVWMSDNGGVVICNYNDMKKIIPALPPREELQQMDFYIDQNIVEK